jgi:NACHT domain
MLEDLEPVRMDASDRTTCLPTTRHDVLSFIINWATRPSGDTANILWVHGLAGAGKSTIATTVANYFHDLGRLGAFLFFDRGFPEKSHPSKVIRTLAHQLGSYDSRIGMALSEIINKDRMIPLCALSSQFTKLIINPLSSLEVLHSQGPILIVLDALDECGSPDERQKLLKVLAEQVKDLPSNLRFLITSRAERDIHCAFQSVPHILHLELRLTSTEGNQDILAYFRYRMTAIRMKNEHLGLPADWPGRENILELTTRAYGLFIWASTASDFIDAHNPDKRLKLLLQGDLSSGSQRALDILYKTALECAGDWDDEDFVADFRSTVGIILVARIPLSNSAIDELLRGLGVQPSIGIVLRLGCIFQLHPVVRVLHPSFFDFVSTRSRCDRNTWVFEPGPYHGVLGKQCLDWLEGELKENMCDLTLSANLTDEHLSEHVSYACTFWIDHICLMNECNRSIIDQVYGFLRRHLLHWFEAMSILKQSRGIREMLSRLLDWIMVCYHIVHVLAASPANSFATGHVS